ncbi:MAG: beta-hydroxyacyl-ACP dehydratase [Marinilabiliales bacterium]
MQNVDLSSKIISILPYSTPFLFVDKIINIDSFGITGEYFFKKSEYFYSGHFVSNPVTPGVILLETMGQIGAVCYGIYLLDLYDRRFEPLLSNLKCDFYKKVYPETKVIVISEKEFYRNGILRCNIKMEDVNNQLIATTTVSCSFNLLS